MCGGLAVLVAGRIDGWGVVADRLLVELGADGQVSVGQWLDGELPDTGVPTELAWPLHEDALEDLRWYLEDYLRAPFGVYGDRGPEVEARLAEWGEAVFSAVFGTGPARDAYVRMRARQTGVEVVFRSPSPALLGLPWELMRDPGRVTPLALDLALSRSLPVAESAETVAVPGGRLRVLMVISRPAGAGDVGYRMIARPLLDRLEVVRGQVDLVVLRPPTLDALGEVLAEAAEAGQPFQVVHFDGHGAMAGGQAAGAGASWTFQGPGPEGVLVFEKPGGGPDQVPASRVAQVLKAGQVPVVVLNACQSGAVGKQLEAAVATRLLQEGIASVVAMAYTVYAVAAAEFMAAFYERLFAGDTVSVAMTAGRRRLFRASLRPSPKGDMALADWVVPVHYLRRDVSFPQARTLRAAGELPLDAALDRIRESVSAHEGGERSLEPVGSFVGRDVLFFDLEGAARLQRVVVLQGPGGTGKTELAKAFGRWWRDTGGVEHSEWVFWHSFEPGVASFGLAGMITEIGLGVWGPDFAAQEPDDRRKVVENLLQDHRLLLIWDNFETVQAMPDSSAATLPLDEAGRQELKDFLDQVARGRSSVIITSRASEDWLGGVRRIAVGGLAVHEAAEYAEDLLAPYPAAQLRRAGRAFGELMEWLDGHPLSMQLILPQLNDIEPGVLLDRLSAVRPMPGETDIPGGRTTSLGASITYSYSHLAAGTRRLLPAVSLSQGGVADVNLLAALSAAPTVPGRFAGTSREEWVQALDEAAGVGLLTPLGGGMYRIHPALPAYLAAKWRTEEPQDHGIALEAAMQALLTAYARYSAWLYQQIRSGDAGQGFALIDLQRRSMGRLLSYALDHDRWNEANSISRALNPYWDARGLYEEASAWADRVRLATEDPGGTPPALESSAGELWQYIVTEQANRLARSGHLDDAERTYHQMLVTLQSQPASPGQQQDLAAIIQNLGNVAQQRDRLAEAEDLYTKSLALKEELGDRLGIANTYHQLGILARDRGKLDEAKAWDAKRLAIMEELGDRRGMAMTYHELGRVAEAQGRLDEAENWYHKALSLNEDIGDRPGIATTYHELGIIAFMCERLAEAEDWYTRSLAIKEELGDRPGIAHTYHQLGMVALDLGRIDEAENWYLKSLAIEEELGNRRGMAMSFGELGLVAEERGQPIQALEQTIRCVALFEEFPHPATEPGPRHLARLTQLLGVETLEKYWQAVTGSALPQAVRDYVESSAPSGGA